jgi:predicted ATPase
MFDDNFSRIFVKNEELERFRLSDNKRLSLSAKNLESVLKRILTNDILRNEIFEWLESFVPGFKSVEVDDRNELRWFEKFTPDYFTKDLISDGTYNILALLTAIYQSDEPQFLCIEEPENGLNPEVVKELVEFLRYKCAEKGHYVWLNTHSQTLVSQLTSDEIIVVDKVEGSTQIKQFRGRDFHGLRMDEAWLMNVLGGGLPW